MQKSARATEMAPGVVRVVDEFRDFDFDLPADTLTLDFPDTRTPECAKWDRHGGYAELSKAWRDGAGDRFVQVILSRRNGALFTAACKVRPLSSRTPGEHCLVHLPSSERTKGGAAQFWPCIRELELS